MAERIALPSITQPIIDRRRTWQPVWWKFIKPALEKVNDHTQQLVAVSEDLTSASAAITAEATARANADGALASSISAVTAAYQLADGNLTSAINNEASARSSADGALTTQINSVSSAYAAADLALQTSITNEANARVSADGVLATSISNVQAGYQAADTTLGAAISSEATARVNADGALSSQISSVSSTVNGNSASITTLQSSVNGLQAKYVLTVNANGRIAGIELASGAGQLATVSILADKFIIVHPSANGTTIQAFITGIVNGIASIGINGNLIVDGTISATKIIASTISAISANLGTITAGLIRDVANTYQIQIDNGLFTSTDGKAYLDLKNKRLRFTP